MCVCTFLQTHTSVTNKIKGAVNVQHVRIRGTACVWLLCDAGVCATLVSREIFCNECNYLRGRLA